MNILEISEEDQAKIEEFMTNKPQKKWHGSKKDGHRPQHDYNRNQQRNQNQGVRPLLQTPPRLMTQPTPLMNNQPFQRFPQPRKIHINPHFQGTVRPPINAPVLNQGFQSIPRSSGPVMIPQGAATPYSNPQINQVLLVI